MLPKAMTFIERFQAEFETEAKNTRKILGLVPEEKFGWRPHEKSMTLGRLAGHIAELTNWAMHAMQVDTLELTPSMKPFQPATRVELMKRFEENLEQARAAMADARDEQMSATWRLRRGGATLVEMPRGAVLRAVVMNHTIHHRGQLTVYLRLLDLPIPGMYGPSADEMNPLASQ